MKYNCGPTPLTNFDLIPLPMFVGLGVSSVIELFPSSQRGRLRVGSPINAAKPFLDPDFWVAGWMGGGRLGCVGVETEGWVWIWIWE
ncbi:hypothetical protein HRS9139_03541 [Pyrenophora teres f. teres]|nr:hypothetical protein HRS9139_03541 [Pyrenophora teres f. teres]